MINRALSANMHTIGKGTKYLPICLLLIFVAMLPSRAAGPGYSTEEVMLTAQDGARSQGRLYLPDGSDPTTALFVSHPGNDRREHWVILPVVKGGYAVLGLNNRFAGEDGIHEEVLLDLAAGIRYLKGRGISRVVGFGQSGGGSMFTFYQNQAVTAPPHRISSTPAADPPNLNEMDLPPLDGIILSNAHEGEGRHLMHHLDPSIVDERDPLSIDPALDMYNPENGFRVPPESSSYSEGFKRKFTEAQKARVERLDALARDLIRRQRYYKSLLASPEFGKLSGQQRQQIEREARVASSAVMVLYRMEADLGYTDLSIDPSDRLVGNNRSNRPDLLNYGDGTARYSLASPQAYLSTMSGLSSNVDLYEQIKKVTVPVLIVGGTADLGVRPGEPKRAFELCGSSDKTIKFFEGGDHQYLPSGPKSGDGKQREQMLEFLIAWMNKRF